MVIENTDAARPIAASGFVEGGPGHGPRPLVTRLTVRPEEVRPHMRTIHAGRVAIPGPLAARRSAAIAAAGVAGCNGRAEAPRGAAAADGHRRRGAQDERPGRREHAGDDPGHQRGDDPRAGPGVPRGEAFHEGTDVKTGQLLLVIDEEPYQVKLDQAKAKLAEAEAALKKAEQSKAREVAEAQLLLDEAQRSLDQVEEKRERSLLNRNAATIEDVDASRPCSRRAAPRSRPTRPASSRRGPTTRPTSSRPGPTSRRPRPTVRDAEINLGYCRMSAPIDGRIGQALVKLGNLVGADKNTDLVTIQQLDPMGVDLNPPARRLPVITELVKKGLYANLSVEGGGEYPQPSKVYFIDNTVEPTTGTFLMKASVPNPEEELLPGEYVRVRATIGSYGDVIVVPEKAVIEGQAGPTVFVVERERARSPWSGSSRSTSIAGCA